MKVAGQRDTLMRRELPSEFAHERGSIILAQSRREGFELREQISL
jgi:hypothetical protein